MRCSVGDDECIPSRLRLGLCEKHYRRQRAHGTTASPWIDNLSHYSVSSDGCWIWGGVRWPNGYGKTSVPVHGTRLAHRAFYMEHVGPIPDGLDVDHACHNADPACTRGPGCPHRACVNPAHLMPASRSANLTNAINSRTTCQRGLHDLTKPGATMPGTKQCVECWRIRYRAAGRRYVAKKRAIRDANR